MTDETKRKPFLDLSATQLIGGSLAAATAAALGSRLGVVGTIVGAALVSVVSAVAGALYTQSLRRTQELIRAREMLGARERLAKVGAGRAPPDAPRRPAPGHPGDRGGGRGRHSLDLEPGDLEGRGRDGRDPLRDHGARDHRHRAADRGSRSTVGRAPR
jgi:hypothetical protein